MLDPDPTRSGEAKNGRLDTAKIMQRLWAGRSMIAVIATASTVLTILYLHTQTFSYSATLTLVPTQSQNQGLSGQIGGIASLAGINLSSTSANMPFTIYGDALNTRDVAETALRRAPDVMQRLYRAEWNEEKRSWQEPFSLRREVAGVIKPLVGIPRSDWTPPSGADLQQYIVQNVKLSQEIKRPVIVLEYYNPDPKFAAYFLKLVHESTDDVLRRMTLDRSSKYARYLETKLQTEQGTDLRKVLIEALSEQETLLMMGNSGTPFAAQPLGVPIISLYPMRPRGSVILLAGVLAGIALGAFLAIHQISIADLWNSLPGKKRRPR